MDRYAKVGIVIAGHTNTGKTTLIRTFMKTSIGEVGDFANVTKRGKAYYYDGLQADFIDTPGFQFADIYNLYLDGLEEDPGFRMPSKWQDKIQLDLDAIKAIEISSVALYVGSLSVVPDDSYAEELIAVKRLQPRVIGILNQYQKELTASSQEEVAHRISLWKAFFSEHKVSNVVVFDAHWDKYSKVNEIYDNIYEILNAREKDIFQRGLTEFKNRQVQIRAEACRMLAFLVESLQDTRVTSHRSTYFKEETVAKISERVRDSTINFTENVNALYTVAAEYPTETLEGIKMRFKDHANLLARLRAGSGSVVVFGAIGALFGTILSVGLGGTGVVLGVQIGTAIGGGVGSLAGLASDDEDMITVSLVAEEIEELVIKCLAIVWGLSTNGYGRDRALTVEETEAIDKQISAISDSLKPLDWMNVGKHTIINHCQNILEELERN